MLSKLGGRADETLLAAQLPEWRTTNSLDRIFQVGVADAPHDVVSVVGLYFLVDAVLLRNEVRRVGHGSLDLFMDLRVLQRVVHSALSAVVAVVCCCGVAGV